ncbi:MAG: hypothetical protein M4579_003596 [Chaenotheca gracillima]|nr:MAG: hypothetical protein M4579_003596 [Chaenotheca gracillima]
MSQTDQPHVAPANGAPQSAPNGNVPEPEAATATHDEGAAPNTHQHGGAKEQFLKAKQKVKKEEEKFQQKSKGPAGGFDSTPIPRAAPGYTLRFTFHRATNLPFADINSLSSDPYVLAQLNTGLATRHPEDPPLRFRTPTIRRSTDPTWECTWVVANVPANGFKLKARVYDEDPADHDDRLGNVHVTVDHIDERWPGIQDQPYGIRKRMGSKRAYLIRGIAVLFSKAKHMNGNLFMSVEVLGRTEGEGGRAYTVGPLHWTKHLSPMIGRLAGTKGPSEEGKAETYNFQANQFQLQGPVPATLYHRYVEFRPFIKGMFSKDGLRGRVLNRALHHQHSRVYNYDKDTIYGEFAEPSREMAAKFLDMVHYDQGGRMYTYVLTLDGMFRFTETGKEFGIDLLSKHTMHSDVNIYIAFSGEFFIHRLKYPNEPADSPNQQSHPPDEISGGPPKEEPPRNVSAYELIIDNDSGTYRPNGKYLPVLQAYFEANFPGLKIQALACDDEKLTKMKKQQKERKTVEGSKRRYVQTSSRSGSVSSSDVSELNEQEDAPADENNHKPNMVVKGEKKVREPETKLKDWVEGDHERERRETADDMAAESSRRAHQSQEPNEPQLNFNPDGHQAQPIQA